MVFFASQHLRMVKTIPAAMMHGITATHFCTLDSQHRSAETVKDVTYHLQERRSHVREGRTAAWALKRRMCICPKCRIRCLRAFAHLSQMRGHTENIATQHVASMKPRDSRNLEP